MRTTFSSEEIANLRQNPCVFNPAIDQRAMACLSAIVEDRGGTGVFVGIENFC